MSDFIFTYNKDPEVRRFLGPGSEVLMDRDKASIVSVSDNILTPLSKEPGGLFEFHEPSSNPTTTKNIQE